jgi:hypothetical protein
MLSPIASGAPSPEQASASRPAYVLLLGASPLGCFSVNGSRAVTFTPVAGRVQIGADSASEA